MKKYILTFLALIPSFAFAELSSIVELVSQGVFRSADLKLWSQEYQKSSSMNELCLKLLALENKELVYFETIISAEISTCFQSLEKRVRDYNNALAAKHYNNYFSSLGERESYKHLRQLNPAPNVPDRPDLGLVNTATGPVYMTGDLPEGYVALTFDDGPHPRLTPEILEILQRYSARATFFPVGRNVKRLPHLVQDLFREGHSYGSHTMTHPNLANSPYSSAVREIEEGLNVLTDVTGVEMRFFRFPYGATTSRLKRYLKREGFASFFWNIDSLDWKHRNPTLIHNEVVSLLNRKKRGIMLFHDIVGATPSALETLMQELTRKGYKIVHFRPDL